MGKPVAEASSNIDQGWAWVVLASSFLLHMITYGMSWSTGVYNVIFLHEFMEDKSTTALVTALNTAMLYGIGPVAGMLTNKYGCRTVIIIGGILSFIGLTSSYFAPNLSILSFTFGVITGTGYGIVYVPTITAMSLYFKRRLSLAVGMASSGTSIGNFLYPALIRWLTNAYDWRSSLLILSAVNLNIIACAAVIRPIKTCENINKSKVLDISPFKKKAYIMLCLNNLLYACGSSAMYIHVSAYAELNGIDKNSSAFLISGIGIANFVGRLGYGVVGQHPSVNHILLYTGSFAMVGVTFFIVPSLTSYVGMMVIVAVFGLLTGCWGTLLAPILVTILGRDRFANGYGCLLLFEAVGQMSGGPISGAMFDVTGSYSMTFYISGIFCVVSALAMIYPCMKYTSSSENDYIDEEHNREIEKLGSSVLVEESI